MALDCAIWRLYRHNGAMNKSIKLEPGTTEWNQTCYIQILHVVYVNCNGEFLEKDCSSAEIVFGCF